MSWSAASPWSRGCRTCLRRRRRGPAASPSPPLHATRQNTWAPDGPACRREGGGRPPAGETHVPTPARNTGGVARSGALSPSSRPTTGSESSPARMMTAPSRSQRDRDPASLARIACLARHARGHRPLRHAGHAQRGRHPLRPRRRHAGPHGRHAAPLHHAAEPLPPAGPRHHAAQPRHAVPCRARQEGVVHLPRPPANPMRRRSPTPPPSGAFASAAAWRWR